MTIVALLRHGETAWNAEGRIQGQTDVPLSEAGRAKLRGAKLPEACRGMRVVTSPLGRCVETATLLGFPDVPREPRLMEMNWGAWQGSLLQDLRKSLGESFRENEGRGLDFRPPGGESPRDVMGRVSEWLKEQREPTLAITHRGVIRVVLAAATGWNMLGKPPANLDRAAVHIFEVEGDGGIRIRALNVRWGNGSSGSAPEFPA